MTLGVGRAALGIGRVLVAEDEIKARVSELGQEITSDYRGRVPTFVGVLKGSFIFLSDLVRAVDLEPEVALFGVSSYSGAEQGRVKVTYDLAGGVEGKDLILVDGVVDTGLTISHLLRRLRSKSPSSLRTCVLLDKRSRRKAEVTLDYVGFEIRDLFVVGYGLDYNERFRNLPHIAAFAPEAHLR